MTCAKGYKPAAKSAPGSWLFCNAKSGQWDWAFVEQSIKCQKMCNLAEIKGFFEQGRYGFTLKGNGQVLGVYNGFAAEKDEVFFGCNKWAVRKDSRKTTPAPDERDVWRDRYGVYEYVTCNSEGNWLISTAKTRDGYWSAGPGNYQQRRIQGAYEQARQTQGGGRGDQGRQEEVHPEGGDEDGEGNGEGREGGADETGGGEDKPSLAGCFRVDYCLPAPVGIFGGYER